MLSRVAALLFVIAVMTAAAPAYDGTCSDERDSRSISGDHSTAITFVNRTGVVVYVYWLNYQGQRQFYQQLAPGQSYRQQTYLTHPWVVASKFGHCFGIYLPERSPTRVVVHPFE